MPANTPSTGDTAADQPAMEANAAATAAPEQAAMQPLPSSPPAGRLNRVQLETLRRRLQEKYH